MKMESEDSDAADSSQNQPMELTTTPSESRLEMPNTTLEHVSSLPPPPHVRLLATFFHKISLLLLLKKIHSLSIVYPLVKLNGPSFCK